MWPRSLYWPYIFLPFSTDATPFTYNPTAVQPHSLNYHNPLTGWDWPVDYTSHGAIHVLEGQVQGQELTKSIRHMELDGTSTYQTAKTHWLYHTCMPMAIDRTISQVLIMIMLSAMWASWLPSAWWLWSRWQFWWLFSGRVSVQLLVSITDTPSRPLQSLTFALSLPHTALPSSSPGLSLSIASTYPRHGLETLSTSPSPCAASRPVSLV